MGTYGEGSTNVPQHSMSMHTQFLSEQHLCRNEIDIKGKTHWQSRLIRICLAPKFLSVLAQG